MINKLINSFQSLFIQRNKEKVVKAFFFLNYCIPKGMNIIEIDRQIQDGRIHV